MNATQIETRADYDAALQGCAWRARPGAGYIVLSGETRFDYLQRQTSNDMGLLSEPRALPNVLTAPTGRILEIFTVLAEGDSYILLTPDGHGPGLAAYFQKRIFFNDQIEITDASAAWIQIEVHGPQAAATLAALGLTALPERDQLAATDWQGHRLRALGIPGFAGQPGVLLIAPAAASEALQAALAEQGAAALSATSAEILRVEAGLPGPVELGGDYTPFEVGLAERVSGNKGCYTGQEVLARQVTYDKVTRQLVQLECEGLAEPGAAVQADGSTVGALTSVARSPRLGPLALAVVRRPHQASGTPLTLTNQEVESAATVRALP